MIQLLIASMLAFAQSPTPANPNEPYFQCLETCKAFADAPGYEIRMCVAQCAPLNQDPRVKAKQIEQEAYALRCQLEPNLCQ